MFSFRPAAFGCAALLSMAPAQAQTLALVDCARVCAPVAPVPALPYPSLVDLRLETEPYRHLLRWYDEDEAPFEVDEFTSLVYLDHWQLLDEGEVSIEPLEGGLAVLISGNEHARAVVDTTRGLVELLGAPIAIDAVLIRGDSSLSPPAVLDRAQADALFGHDTPTWRGAGSTLHRRAIHLGKHRAVAYDRTAILEVAEESQIHAAVTSQLLDGTALTIRPHRLAGSDGVFLQVQFALGNLLDLGTLEHDVDAAPALERPVLQSTAGSMSGLVAPGGAIALRVQAPEDLGGSLVLAVRARPEPLPALQGSDYQALPISAATMGGGEATPLRMQFGLAASPDDEEIYGFSGEEDFMPIDSARLEDLVHNSIDPDAWDDTQRLYAGGGYFHVHAPEASRKKVAELIAYIERQLVANTEVWVSHGQGAYGIWLPTTTSRVHAIRHGVESTAIRGIAVEIAKEAAGSLPSVVSTHDGLTFQVRTTRGQSDVFAQLRWIEERTTEPGAGVRHHLAPMEQRVQAHTGALPTAGVATGDGLFGPQTWHAAVRAAPSGR